MLAAALTRMIGEKRGPGDVGLLVGLAVGAINGLAVTNLRVPPFIVSLAMMLLGALGTGYAYILNLRVIRVAGSTMVAYATILKDVLPNAAAHVLTASIISAPAGVLLARILIPRSPETETSEQLTVEEDKVYESSVDVKGIDKESAYALNVQYRSGDVTSPKLDQVIELR